MNTIAVTSAVLVLLLAGCAGLANKQRQEEVNAYCRQVYSDPRLDPIREKVPINITFADSIPVRMLANDNYPTKEEAAAILSWAEQRQLCQTKATEMFGPAPAHLAAVRDANSQSMADLYAGKLTYGEYIRQYSDHKARFLEVDQAVRAQAAEYALRAQQAFSQQLYQQQQLNLQRQQIQAEQFKALQPNRSLHCITSYIGNQAYTNCN